MPGEVAAAQAAGEGEGTALEGGAQPPEGTALDAGGSPPDPDTPIEIPDKFKNDDGTLKDQALLKSYGEMEKVLGRHGKPPETVDDYKLELEGKFPEGVELDETVQKEFLSRCHEKGLTNDMVQFIYDEYANIIGEAANAQAETREGTVEQLKELYGNDYHKKMGAAMNAFKAAGIEGLDINEVGNNPAMIQILAELGANLTEDQLPGGMDFGGVGGLTEEELDSLMKSESYLQERHPDHKATMAKVKAHFQAKFPKKKQ